MVWLFPSYFNSGSLVKEKTFWIIVHIDNNLAERETFPTYTSWIGFFLSKIQTALMHHDHVLRFSFLDLCSMVCGARKTSAVAAELQFQDMDQDKHVFILLFEIQRHTSNIRPKA